MSINDHANVESYGRFEPIQCCCISDLLQRHIRSKVHTIYGIRGQIYLSSSSQHYHNGAEMIIKVLLLPKRAKHATHSCHSPPHLTVTVSDFTDSHARSGGTKHLLKTTLRYFINSLIHTLRISLIVFSSYVSIFHQLIIFHLSFRVFFQTLSLFF